jgi:hypothetical protein
VAPGGIVLKKEKEGTQKGQEAKEDKRKKNICTVSSIRDRLPRMRKMGKDRLLTLKLGLASRKARQIESTLRVAHGENREEQRE